MRKPVLIIGALAAAGFVAFAGGSAFTDSNTFTPTNTVAGYGTVTATGVTVDAVHYVQDPANSTNISSVVFTAHTDLSVLTPVPTATVSFDLTGTTPAHIGTFSCVIAAGASGTSTVTCDTNAHSVDATPVTTGVPITSFNQTALTVLS